MVQQEQTIRSYVEYTKTVAQEKYDSLETYSPLAFSVVKTTMDTTKAYTPGFLQNTVSSAAESLEGYVDVTDELLEAALNRTNEFPRLLEEIKQTLTQEQLWLLLSQVKDNSKAEITKYLPSAAMNDFQLQERVQNIVGMVLSQPQLFKDQAANLADRIKERANKVSKGFDVDGDGKVSVRDLAGSVYGVSAGVAGYCSSIITEFLPSSEIVTNLLNMVLTDTRTKPIVDVVNSQWMRTVEFITSLQPLWNATELLKHFVSTYTSNVKSRFDPLTPYLMMLIADTSVINLPFELLHLAKNTAGLEKDSAKEEIAQETRALLWALVDISFILEAIKENPGAGNEVHAIDGVTLVKDAGKETL